MFEGEEGVTAQKCAVEERHVCLEPTEHHVCLCFTCRSSPGARTQGARFSSPAAADRKLAIREDREDEQKLLSEFILLPKRTGRPSEEPPACTSKACCAACRLSCRQLGAQGKTLHAITNNKGVTGELGALKGALHNAIEGK